MKENPEVNFHEPQSMNFDKKFTEIYKEFQIYCSKQNFKQTFEHSFKDPDHEINDLEDSIFEIPIAASLLKIKMNDHETLKRFLKESRSLIRQTSEYDVTE
jgi:hypothetical protein